MSGCARRLRRRRGRSNSSFRAPEGNPDPNSGPGAAHRPGMTGEPTGRASMSATFATSLARPEARPFHLAVIAGLACAFVIGKALPSTMDAISAVIAPLCASSESRGIGARHRRADRLLRAAERAGQARHHRAGVLRPRRIYPRASSMPARSPPTSPRARSARSLAAVRSRPSRSVNRSSSRRAPPIWSRPMRAIPSPLN